MNIRQMAGYPFLRESADYLRKNGPQLSELLQGLAFERTRSMGKERILEALENAQIAQHSLITDADSLTELLSYVTARMMVSCINDSYLTKRYALAEAKTAGERLQNEDLDFVVMVASELGLEVHPEGGNLRLHFIHYLKNTSQMRSRPWKLANQEVKSGYVTLDKNRLVRVVEQALQLRIENDLPLKVNDDILKGLGTYLRDISAEVETKKSTFSAKDFGKVRVTKLPPCMRTMLAKVQANENLPHSGRFALTAFLHAIGMSSEDIMNLFSQSPDFDQDKTRYQVEHITGNISGTKYTPPECSTMKSYGICYGEDKLCKKEWMIHPLKYYRVKDKEGKQPSKSSEKNKENEKA